MSECYDLRRRPKPFKGGGDKPLIKLRLAASSRRVIAGGFWLTAGCLSSLGDLPVTTSTYIMCFVWVCELRELLELREA